MEQANRAERFRASEGMLKCHSVTNLIKPFGTELSTTSYKLNLANSLLGKCLITLTPVTYTQIHHTPDNTLGGYEPRLNICSK